MSARVYLENGEEAPTRILNGVGELLPDYCPGCGNYTQQFRLRNGKKARACRNAACPRYKVSPK